MKRHKRDMNQRAYQRGYHAGLCGKDREACPHENMAQREQWLGGWLEGRDAQWSAMTGISGLSELSRVESA
ncbi:MAG: ribosome modulation factor [Pseudomonadales bacterium]